MGIEKIGLSVVHTVPNVRSDAVEKSVARSERRLEFQRNSAKAENRAETERIKAESQRISDSGKIDKKGRNAPAPNVKYTKGSIWQNSNYYRHASGGNLDRYA